MLNHVGKQRIYSVILWFGLREIDNCKWIEMVLTFKLNIY